MGTETNAQLNPPSGRMGDTAAMRQRTGGLIRNVMNQSRVDFARQNPNAFRRPAIIKPPKKIPPVMGPAPIKQNPSPGAALGDNFRY